MLTLFKRQKVTKEKLANIFVNSILELLEGSFEDVIGIIEDDPQFSQRPYIDKENSDDLLFIIIAANLNYFSDFFDKEMEDEITDKLFEKFATIYGIKKVAFQKLIRDYQSFLWRVNHPSNNTLYAMSKAVFFKYNLNQYQQDYFKKLNVPNPIFLKRLDEVMQHFIWDWSGFLNKYKIIA